VERLQQLAELSGCKISPGAYGHPLDAQGTDPDATQTVHRDPGALHEAADDVVQPLMDDDLEDEPVPGLAQDPELGRDDLLAVDDEAVPDPL
jgi:hypothetical protein